MTLPLRSRILYRFEILQIGFLGLLARGLEFLIESISLSSQITREIWFVVNIVQLESVFGTKFKDESAQRKIV